MADADRWEPLDDHLPPDVRGDLEERFWRPIEAEATLEALRDDPSFYADPGRHPAMFADHGVVHVRDVAVSLVRLVETVDGVLLARRPADRLRFVQAYGVAATYLHDVGMVDMSATGRRIHAIAAAHVAFGPGLRGLIDFLLARGPVRDRLERVAARAPFSVPMETVVRELLSLTAAHSKSLVPPGVLDDRAGLRQLMRRLVFTTLDEHRAAPRLPTSDDEARDPGANPIGHPNPAAAYEWLSASDGPQAELVDDVVDAIRALRAADVLRQRGSALRTSGGYEICFDAETARAVCTLRTASGDAAYLVEYDDARGAGEANLRVAFVTPTGDLRIAFHRGSFGDAEAAARAAANVANAVVDIAEDVIPSFEGRPARGLPPPTRGIGDVRIQLERPDDRPTFADDVAESIATLAPGFAHRVETVSNVEAASADERGRFHAATPIRGDEPLAIEIVRQLAAHGSDVVAIDVPAAFAEVRRATLHARERLVATGSPPAFVYVPMGPGLIVLPGGGYAPSPVQPWVPVGTTGVIRRAERNSEIVALTDVEVVMIPGERYAASWLRPLTPEELRARLAPAAPVP